MSSKSFILDKPKWQLESSVNTCSGCGKPFSDTVKKHHCRACGKIHCYNCVITQAELPFFGYTGLQAVCKACKITIETDQGLIISSTTAVKLMMRDMTTYTFKTELFHMGARGAPRKLQADVRTSDGFPFIFSMVNSTDDSAAIFKEESKRRLFAFIIKDTITHPYIMSPHFAQLRDTKAVVSYPFSPAGSIRDLIYLTPDLKKKKINPKSPYLDKYGSMQGVPLDEKVIARYGRQILEALFYLYLHGFPYPHLHSGNVIINENDHAQLCDLENSLLLLDPLPLRSMKKVSSVFPDIPGEVLAFGFLLYEMAMGHEKGERSLKDAKSSCPSQIYSILESILEPPNADSTASLKSLLRLPFFQEVQLEVTIHQVVLTEKWDDRARAVLKLVRTSTAKLLAPPQTPSLRSSNSGINLADNVSSSTSTPSVSHSSSSTAASKANSGHLRKKSSTTLSASSGHSRTSSGGASAGSLSNSSTSNTTSKSTSTTSSSKTAHVPVPPPPPKTGAPGPPPPPPPPSVAKSMPSAQPGRNDLLAAIRAARGKTNHNQ